MKYVVEIEETYRKHLVVEADSEREAEKKVDSAYAKGYIDMEKEIGFDCTINCIGAANELDIDDYSHLDDGNDEEEKDHG